MEIGLLKIGDGFCPATHEDKEKHEQLKGYFFKATIKQKRNLKFHKKFFAMIGVGFDSFDPPPLLHNGLPIIKNFKRFRKDVVIAAGFCSMVMDFDGEVVKEADSLRFSRMSQDTFENVYNACCNVLLERVLNHYTREDIDSIVDQLVRF